LFWALQDALMTLDQNAQDLEAYYTKRFVTVNRSPDKRRIAQLTFHDDDKPLELTVGAYGHVGTMLYSLSADHANNVVVNGVNTGGVEGFTEWLLGECRKVRGSEERN